MRATERFGAAWLFIRQLMKIWSLYHLFRTLFQVDYVHSTAEDITCQHTKVQQDPFNHFHEHPVAMQRWRVDFVPAKRINRFFDWKGFIDQHALLITRYRRHMTYFGNRNFRWGPFLSEKINTKTIFDTLWNILRSNLE